MTLRPILDDISLEPAHIHQDGSYVVVKDAKVSYLTADHLGSPRVGKTSQ